MKKDMRPNNQWEKIIDEYRSSGMTAIKFCEGKDFTVTALKYHLYHKPKSKKSVDSVSSSDQIEFVPVSLKQEEPVYDSKILISLPSGASISVDHSTDLLLLKNILEVLS